MSKKIIVGISQRVDMIDSYGEQRDALDQRLINWVLQSNFIPIPIPNKLIHTLLPNSSHNDLNDWLNTFKVDAILLSGGNDIGASVQRDITEQYLLSWAEKNKKPVLGICRGMQMMGIYAGVELRRVNGHIGVMHKLINEDKGCDLFPDLVNSFHNMVLGECPDNFKLLASSEDGNIEAIMHKELPWEAWMWHPEREEIFSESNQDRFKKLVINEKK